MKRVSPEVIDAEKAVANVLANLETQTQGEVKDIDLEDMVDTDPKTGAPVVKKAVEITLQERPRKRWST